MDDKIRQLIKELEQQYGSPVQISVERPKETEQVLGRDYRNIVIFPTNKRTYGSLENRACEVLPCPVDADELKHDQDLLIGRYPSLRKLNERIEAIPQLYSFCDYGFYFDKELRKHLASKYEVKEKVVGIAHGGQADWYTVDGVEADLSNWSKTRPDLYMEACGYLLKNKIPFWFCHQVATPLGVYTFYKDYVDIFGAEDVFEHYLDTRELESIKFTGKTAEVKLDLLK